ncbi:DNA protecting protein DprA [Anaerocolumna cellulosilytica]|uniref:DNA protecting protein DprA n=1 Tax=Anaerocolumna cellulosilytica TaxID=433286 RepID=A0A6S6QNG9_9FIRM|nr:DNA-processing protein DprA [Anaerocolumna cellulosilytica]MBB5195762.1 putative Rossmann fold nucleotide-binding protein DprA/Smf involved in DNA uptake [Anaerocolumna cellulosilytica]BCJ92903.1 DNA protecting protein DprA [Anaerocolumna cellulosilytica]
MKFSDNAMSAILLCSYIGINKDDTAKPFSLGEWNQFLDKVIDMKLDPSVVLSNDMGMLTRLKYSSNEIERIKKLVSRGGAVAFEIDDLSNKGIEVITLFDADYPVLLKRKLKRKTPPILFYAGDINLAKKIGIAVVGSRDVDQAGMEFTRKLVSRASEERLVVYSGGAKGVDSISEITAIENGSAVVSFIADSLSAKIKKKEVLKNILQQKLLLISDVKPEAGFSAARAMNRNKYIYAAAYGAFVISSDYNKGGTWAGAIENIKNDWTKEFVWNHKEYNGNIKLIEKGAIPYELSDEKIYDSITKKESSYNQLDIFNLTTTIVNETSNEYKKIENQNIVISQDIYEVVKDYIVGNIGSGLSLEQASEQFKVAKGQMKIWLKRLCDDEKIILENAIYSKKSTN